MKYERTGSLCIGDQKIPVDCGEVDVNFMDDTIVYFLNIQLDLEFRVRETDCIFLLKACRPWFAVDMENVVGMRSMGLGTGYFAIINIT